MSIEFFLSCSGVTYLESNPWECESLKSLHVYLTARANQDHLSGEPLMDGQPGESDLSRQNWRSPGFIPTGSFCRPGSMPSLLRGPQSRHGWLVLLSCLVGGLNSELHANPPSRHIRWFIWAQLNLNWQLWRIQSSGKLLFRSLLWLLSDRNRWTDLGIIPSYLATRINHDAGCVWGGMSDAVEW